MSRHRGYLERLPARAQHRGDAEEGEAEIVTSRADLAKIAAECAAELKGSALGKGGKRIGILLEDEVRMVVRDALRFPTGATKCEIRVVGKTEFDGPSGIVALCVREGKFILREIFRHATRAWELETVRGRRELGQTSRQAVRSEVKQELGYAVKRMHPLGKLCPDSAVVSSTLDLFFVELGEGPRKDDPEESETFGRIREFTPGGMARAILSGEVRDGYTIGALMLAQLRGLVRSPRIDRTAR